MRSSGAPARLQPDPTHESTQARTEVARQAAVQVGRRGGARRVGRVASARGGANNRLTEYSQGRFHESGIKHMHPTAPTRASAPSRAARRRRTDEQRSRQACLRSERRVYLRHSACPPPYCRLFAAWRRTRRVQLLQLTSTHAHANEAARVAKRVSNCTHHFTAASQPAPCDSLQSTPGAAIEQRGGAPSAPVGDVCARFVDRLDERHNSLRHTLPATTCKLRSTNAMNALHDAPWAAALGCAAARRPCRSACRSARRQSGRA